MTYGVHRLSLGHCCQSQPLPRNLKYAPSTRYVIAHTKVAKHAQNSTCNSNIMHQYTADYVMAYNSDEIKWCHIIARSTCKCNLSNSVETSSG